MTVEKPKPKQLLRPITTGTGSTMNQSQFLAITCNSLEAREKSRVHGAIGFAFASHWLKNWHESFKPITKRSNRNHVITFDSTGRWIYLSLALTLERRISISFWRILVFSLISAAFCVKEHKILINTIVQKTTITIHNNLVSGHINVITFTVWSCTNRRKGNDRFYGRDVQVV